MVHERDEKYEGQEDGEYHFSDDQANYEMEPDDAQHSTEATVAAAPKAAAGSGIEQYKRPLIGVTVFVVLIFLVYKITAPSTTVAPGDIIQGSSVAAPVAEQKPAAPANAAPQGTFKPLSPPLGMSSSSTSGVTQPPVAAQQPVVAQTPAAPVQPIILPDATPPGLVQQPAPAVMAQQSSVYNPAHPSEDTNSNSMVAEPAEIALLNQKITVLTEQNAKMQVEYSQKIADYEAQNTALQGKVQDLSTRLANMETTLAHLGRAVQQDTGVNPNRPRTVAAPGGISGQGMMQSEPRSAYTVSAIIPGRAWLKSEGGETVTVAEGDTLKGYGRITKIDPYDGVVELDIGGKTVALSYGATSE